MFIYMFIYIYIYSYFFNWKIFYWVLFISIIQAKIYKLITFAIFHDIIVSYYNIVLYRIIISLLLLSFKNN